MPMQAAVNFLMPFTVHPGLSWCLPYVHTHLLLLCCSQAGFSNAKNYNDQEKRRLFMEAFYHTPVSKALRTVAADYMSGRAACFYRMISSMSL